MNRIFLGAALLCTLLAGAALAAELSGYVVQAVADQTRPKDDRDADALRAPAETIAFAGVKPGMVVGELFPGGGYFTRLLSDVVGPKGKIYGLENQGWKQATEADLKIPAEPGHGNVAVAATPFGQFSVPEKLDLFWITQNYHDLHIKEYGNIDLAVFNSRVFDSLKPGGTYFILDHQAVGPMDDADIAKVHRIAKTQLIAEVEAAGFKLAGEGTFLNRPGDDHTKSIFDPAIRGKTDQYALKFVRP